jgi:hypothetical protein
MFRNFVWSCIGGKPTMIRILLSIKAVKYWEFLVKKKRTTKEKRNKE